MTTQAGKILVVGAGTGGIRAALDLAQAGVRVILAESSFHTGGLVSQLDTQFPTTSCGFCRMLPAAEGGNGARHCLRRGLVHENIDLRLGCSLVSLEGEAGAFTAALDQAAPMVDQDRCMGCGLCETVCPVDIPDPYNQGLSRRRAIGRSCPQALPNAWFIDPAACTLCGACAPVCPTGAIDLVPGGKGAFKILVVDDEAIVRDSMAEWLGLEGYAVATAGSGAEALDQMAEAPFHLMLTDIKMPGMDGVELLARARQRHPGLTGIMMTAYAEVDSAVSAMKEGALEYVTKPFEPETVIAMVARCYEGFRWETATREEIGAAILATGTGFHVPDRDRPIYGYDSLPNVVTALAFERLLSRAGPGMPQGTGRVAWLQCVGSRDRDHGFCSSVCCMISLKQAILARARARVKRADIFYMDLRTPGKTFDRYREEASEKGVGLIRARVHSLSPATGQGSGHGPVALRYADLAGQIHTQDYDMVVLATGQAASPRTEALIQALDLETDDWGFVRPPAFDPHKTCRPGIYTTGGLTGFKDIETTVTLGSAAAISALEDLGLTGGRRPCAGPPAAPAGNGSGVETPDSAEVHELARSAPKIGLLLCTCDRVLGLPLDRDGILDALGRDPALGAVVLVPDLCDPEDLGAGVKQLAGAGANRLILAGCRACMSRDRIREMGTLTGLSARLIRGVDLLTLAGKSLGPAPAGAAPGTAETEGRGNGAKKRGKNRILLAPSFLPQLFQELGRAMADLKRVDPGPRITAEGPGPDGVQAHARALVVGGGLAGMTAALGISRAGFGVDLVEAGETLGGNLAWIRRTAEGDATAPLLSSLVDAVTSRENIHVHLESRVGRVRGLPGRWTTLLDPGGEAVRHGVVVLATGGKEAASGEIGPGILTQKGFQEMLDRGEVPALETLVMVLCRNCRKEEKNYCSRVCCPRALAQALAVLEQYPETRSYVLYRDMMTPGNLEALYTRAREAGMVFIPYEAHAPPQIAPGEPALVTCRDPVLGRDLCIEADAVVLATGIEPELPADLSGPFPFDRDEFGFFKAADPKWQPVEGRYPRVVSCGLALKPCDLALARATAKAAAMKAVAVLSGAPVQAAARVKTALCSLCLACIPACPFGARYLDEEREAIVVDGLACQGCGICAAVCPGKAARVEGLDHYLALIDQAVGAPASPGCLAHKFKEVTP